MRVCVCGKCKWRCWLYVDVVAGSLQESLPKAHHKLASDCNVCMYSVLMFN